MLANGLRVTQTTHEVAASILRRPAPGRLAGGRGDPAGNRGHATQALRDELELGWGPGRERLLAASQLAIRRLMPALPALFRRFPQARAGLLRAA